MTFWSDVRGNTAAILAICLLPMLAIAGGAIDLTRHRTATVETQAALDAALLYIAHETGKRPDPILEREAEGVFLSEMEGRHINVHDFTFARDGEIMRASVDADISTTLLGLIGVNRLAILRNAEVRFSERKFELALALDTTGSMRGDKMDKLKDASTLLVNKLSASTAKLENRKFSLIPFATWVNVGPDMRTENWIDKSGQSSVSASNLLPNTNRTALYAKLGEAWPGCVEARAYPYDTDDTTPHPGDKETLFTPSFYPDEPDDRRSYANDYLNDGIWSWNPMTLIANVAKYGLGAGGRLPDEAVGKKSNYRYYSDVDTPIGPGFNCSTRPVTPLTTNARTITDEIGLLEAEGSTNITEGLAWAWRTLSPGRPFTEGAPYTDKSTEKIIVLLTDGNNHVSRRSDARGSDYSAYGYIANGRMNLAVGASQRDIWNEMDKRTLETCQNAKSAGIIVYTIRLELSGDPRSENLLRECATSPSHYLDVPDADELEAAFNDIADDILDLYLSR